jgi:hypothetical protein
MTEQELLALAEFIGNAIEHGVADRYRNAYANDEAAFRAFARDHLA